MSQTGRIIINICDGISDEDALEWVAKIVEEGKISADGESYCYATTLRMGTVVFTNKPRESGTHVFYVCEDIK